MLLGEIMTALRDHGTAEVALASLGDIVLIAEVDEARAAHAESAGEYAAGAAERFANRASDEDWLALMTALERSHEPAATCLTTMLRWSVRRDLEERQPAAKGGCSCGGGGCDGGG